mmetsp:Transcript_11234/g.12723  ORF Transcript_11234/g.12723 Transcript_11234/m.12723 type:complete len:107 (-) Transcript_11234:417-737(-)
MVVEECLSIPTVYCVHGPTLTEIRRMAALLWRISTATYYCIIQKVPSSFHCPVLCYCTVLCCTVCTTIASLSILVPSQSLGVAHAQHVPTMPSNGEGRKGDRQQQQ